MALPQIRVNVGAPFPTSVQGLGFITLSKQNGVWTFKVDYTQLGLLSPPLNPTTKQVAVFDPSSGGYNVMTAYALSQIVSPNSRVLTPFSVTSNTTLANVPGLSLNLQAGRIYAFDAHLPCTTGATAGGVKAALAAGGGLTIGSINADGDVCDGSVITLANVTALGSNIAAVTTTTTTPRIRVRGVIAVVTSGQLNMQFAQNASNGTASIVQAGAWLKATDIS